jgi:TolB-like protein
MKKLLVLVFWGIAGYGLFAQQLPTVAVATFDPSGGVTRDEAVLVTELFMTELVSKGTVNVVDRTNFDKIIAEMKFQTSDWSNAKKTAALGNANNAQCVIRGQLMKMGNVIYWTATMIDVNTAQVLYSVREQLGDMGEVFNKLSAFVTQMTAKLPPPNYFVGRWVSAIGMYKCILDLKQDGSIIVIQYYYNGGPFRVLTGSGSYSFDKTKRPPPKGGGFH